MLIKNIEDEIAYLSIKSLKYGNLIWDINFTLLKKHVVEFCYEISRRKKGNAL